MTRFRLITLIIAVALLSLIPVSAAFAQDSDGSTALGRVVGSFVTDLVSGILNFFFDIVSRLFDWLAAILDTLINAKMSTGGAPIYFVWKTFRDMCNMFFIVILILISFATIFNSWLSSHSFYYKDALFMVIVAAVTMNLSMAAGQMIVWTGNEASSLVLGLMSNVDISNKVINSMRIKEVRAGNPLTVPLTQIPQSKELYDKLSDEQKATVRGWFGQASAPETEYESSQALSTLYSCLNTNADTPSGCMDRAINIYANDKELTTYTKSVAHDLRDSAWWYDWACLASNIIPSGTVPSVKFSSACVTGTLKKMEADKLDPSGRNEKNLATIADRAFRLGLMIVLTLSLLVVVVFMAVRIPFVWLLLAISSLAFFSLAWPSKDKKAGLFQKWYGTLIGWSFFGPLYLFVIYIGLFVMDQQGAMLASMNAADLPGYAGALGLMLGYAITAGIFTMGAKWAYDTAFSFGAQFDQLGGWMSGKVASGKISEFLGADAKSGYGLTTAARLTGATTAYEMGKANVQAGYERGKQAVRPLTERLKPMDYDERLARAKARFGVTGADQEVAKITAAKVGAEKTQLEQQMLGKNRADRIAFLKGRMNSINKNEALAAREHLLAMGQLNPDQIKETRDMLPSEAAKIAWDQKARKGGREERKKEYADILDTLSESELAPRMKYSAAPFTDRQTAAQNALNAIPNPTAQQEFLNALAERDPEIAATISTASTPALGTRAYDNIVKNPDRVFDLPNAYKWSPAVGGPPPPEFQQLSDAFNRLYPMPPGGTAAPGSAAERALDRRERMKEQLLKAGGVTNADFVEALMRS